MHLLLYLMLAMGVSGTATASLLFTLDSPIFYGAPGDSVPITGTLFNPDPDPVYLNNLSGILASPDLSFDLTDFFTVVPSILNNGASYSGPIVAVLVDPLAQSGDFFASITLQGGVDTSASDDLATQNFQFTVSPSVPEPTSIFLLGGGLAFLVIIHFRRRKFVRIRPRTNY